MNILSWIVDPATATRLTLALLHFLWQGCCGGLLVVVGGWLVRGGTARVRYNLNVATLFLMAACLPATFLLLKVPQTDAGNSTALRTASKVEYVGPTATVPTSAEPVAAPWPEATPTAQPMASGAPEAYQFRTPLPVSPTDATPLGTNVFQTLSRCIAILYLLGVTVILGRLLQGMWGGRRLRRSARLVEDVALLEMVRWQARRLGLWLTPTLGWCSQISIPVVVGIVKPMILLPAAVVGGLTPDQLQALMLHELAHIRRFDPIVNLLQRVIEAVLFFHPLVWFVSHRVSLERELAADDMVLAAGWDRPVYAEALVRIAELSSAIAGAQSACPATVLGATGMRVTGKNPSEFRLRVLRLLGESQPPKLELPRAGLIAVLLAIVLGGAVAWSQPEKKSDPTAQLNGDNPPEIEPGTNKPQGPAPLEFRVAANSADKETGLRVPKDFESRNYPENTPQSRAATNDTGFVWIKIAKSADKAGALPLERIRDGQRFALVADTMDHALLWNKQWSVEACEVVPDPNGEGRFSIEITLNEAGGKALQMLTKAHLNQPLAIVANGEILTAPVVRSEVGRKVAITGNFTRNQAEALAQAVQARQNKDDKTQKKPRADIQPRELERFRELVNQGVLRGPEDKTLIHDVIGWRLEQFQQEPAGKEQQTHTLRVLLQQDLAKAGEPGKPQEVHEEMLRAVIAEIPPLFQCKEISTRLNAVILLAQLNKVDNPEEPCLDAIPLLKAIAANEAENLVVRGWGIKGLTRMARPGWLSPADTGEFARLLADLLEHSNKRLTQEQKQNKTWSWFNTKIIEGLGHADTLRVGKQPRVFEVLARTLFDDDAPLHVRAEAARSLSRLPLDPSVNVHAVVWQTVRLLPAIAAMRDDGEPPGRTTSSEFRPDQKSTALTVYLAFHPLDGDERSHLIGFRTHADYHELAGIKEEILAASGLAGVAVNEILNGDFKQKPDFDQWLKSHAPKDFAIGPGFQDLDPLMASDETIDPQSVAWGNPDAQGFSLGVYLSPKKVTYTLGERVRLLLFVRNDGKQGVPTTWANTTHPMPEDFTITDEKGMKVAVRKGEDGNWELPWISGYTSGQLDAGEIHRFTVPYEISIGGDGTDKRVGRVIEARPGQTLQVRLRANNGSNARKEGDAEPETGTVTLAVAPAADKPSSGAQSAREPAKKPIAKELEPFQGEWAMELCDSESRRLGASQREAGKWRWMIEGDEIRWRRGGEEWKLTFSVAPQKSPKEIDLTYLSGPFMGEKARGMYEWGGIDGMSLLIAIQDPGAKVQRPQKIEMQGGGETGLMFLRRAEPMDTKKERALFQGTWTFANVMTDAWPKPAGIKNGQINERRWVVQGNEISWTGTDGSEVKLSFTMDPTQVPKQIDLTFLTGPHKGQKCPGIYQGLGTEEVWICVVDPGAKVERAKKIAFSTGCGRSWIALEPLAAKAPE